MAKEIPVILKVDKKGADASLQDFKDDIESLQKAIESTPIGSKQFEQLAQKLQKAQSEVKTLEKTMEGLEPQQKAEAFLKMGEGIVGGFTAAQGAMALLGQEDAKLQETMLKVQSAVAIAQGARMVTEGLLNAQIGKRLIMEKASAAQMVVMTGLTAAYNTVVGTATGGLKLFRLALIGTGIGALIVGLGLLIANWEKVVAWVEKATDAFLEFAAPVKKFLEQLNIIDTEEEKNAKNSLERQKKKMEGWDEEERARRHQIELAKLQGRSEQELFNLEEKLLLEKFEMNRRYVADKIKLGEEVTADEKAQLDESRRAVELFRAQRQASLQKEIDDEKKKNAEKLKEQQKQYADYIKNINSQLADARIAGIEDATKREIDSERLALERKLAAIKGNSKIEQELRAQLTANSNAKIAEIQQKANDEAIAKEREAKIKALETSFKDAIARQEAILLQITQSEERKRATQLELYALERDQALSQEDLTQGEIFKIKADYEAKVTQLEIDEATRRAETQKQIDEAKINIAQNTLNGLNAIGQLAITSAKKQEAFQKAVAIAQLAIDTAKSISATIAGATAAAAAGGPAAPFLLAGYITAGITTVLSAFASAKKILGSAQSTQAPQLQSSAQQVSSGVQPQGLQNNDNTARTRIDQSTANVKAYVVESEMTEKQKQVKKIEQGAEI